MKIEQQAVRQLRVKGQQFLKLADLLEELNSYVDGNRPKVKRRKMSRAARLLISKAQKKRWAKARRK